MYILCFNNKTILSTYFEIQQSVEGIHECPVNVPMHYLSHMYTFVVSLHDVTGADGGQ